MERVNGVGQVACYTVGVDMVRLLVPVTLSTQYLIMIIVNYIERTTCLWPSVVYPVIYPNRHQDPYEI